MRFSEVIVGEKFQLGSFTLTKEEILDFAHRYDPQYMHIDEVMAENSTFKGIIASGMQTLAMTWVQWVKQNYYGNDVIAGLGVNNVQFLKPVYPGDELSVEAEVIEKQTWKEDSGAVTVRLTTSNQHQKVAFVAEVIGLIRK